MTQYLTSDSFIVRIYRVDTEDRRKITGLVEALDGSGQSRSFTDIDELGAIVNASIREQLKKRKKLSKPKETG